jgi:tRNA pseudouridine55 synthase
LDGILNINKSAGMTSFRVVAIVKRLTGEKHAGHAGTLDPDATGVLPVCLGKATRVVEFMMDNHKTYRAIIELGVTTDTFDGDGKVVKERDASGVTKKQLEQALDNFRGDVQQTPPMYSALKHQGQPLYQLARAGIDVERQSRAIKIYRLELTEWQPPLVTLEVECSKGTYIRSLANDLGEALGCGAYLKTLVRTQYGNFDIKDAVTLEQVEKDNWQQYLHPIDSVLQDMASLTVDETGEAAIKTGSPLSQTDTYSVEGKYCRAYSNDGRFLAILTRDKDTGVWRPKKVFV